jgi:hypothetical protein
MFDPHSGDEARSNRFLRFWDSAVEGALKGIYHSISWPRVIKILRAHPEITWINAKQLPRSHAPAWERTCGRSRVLAQEDGLQSGRRSVRASVPTRERGNEG